MVWETPSSSVGILSLSSIALLPWYMRDSSGIEDYCSCFQGLWQIICCQVDSFTKQRKSSFTSDKNLDKFCSSHRLGQNVLSVRAATLVDRRYRSSNSRWYHTWHENQTRPNTIKDAVMVYPLSSDTVEVDFHRKGNSTNKQYKLLCSNATSLKSHSPFYTYFGSQLYPLRATATRQQSATVLATRKSLPRRNQAGFQPKDGKQILKWSNRSLVVLDTL